MADVLQNAVNEANRKIVEDNSLKLAHEPQVQFPENKDEIEKAMDAKGDLAFTVALEVLPVFDLVDLSGRVGQEAGRRRSPTPRSTNRSSAWPSRTAPSSPRTGAAVDGDRVVVDFVGRIDGTEFEGGKGQDIRVELGSNTFIPGFEDQLLGLKAGDTKLVKVSFPENYLAPHLAGKAAEFDVTVKEVEAPGELVIDDELAKGFGMESLDKLKEAIRGAVQRDFDAQSRRKVKKELLDALDAKYSFELPPTLVEQEFAAVWAQVEGDMKSNNRTFADEDTTEEEAQGRLSQDRRASRAARFGPCADR